MIEDIINYNRFNYVDLDLPSKTLWATCNVGASRPNEPGLYFQWGDIRGYTRSQVGKDKQFTWKDYKWNPSGDGNTFTKYTKPGDVLEPEDDAVRANMGGSWHMPSPEQIQELIHNTITTWTELDGVDGRLFTSRKDPTKSIFIPAVGGAWNGLIDEDNNFYCQIWSSTLDDDYVYRGLFFESDSEDVSLYSGNRYCGYSVRGVIG